MAVSLPTAALLLGLCRVLQPETVLDLGSGFSSFVFRKYAVARPDVRIVTVDDDPNWLERTRSYLLTHGPIPGELVTWEEFVARPTETFAFVFHDLGNVETRRATMPAALARTSRTGLAVLDDLHKRRVEAVARPAARAARFQLIGVRELTLDSLGRFATVALPVER